MKIEEKYFGLGEIVFKGVNEDGTFEAVISGIKTDRYGDTIDPAGWELKAFNKNPVILWAHDHYTPTIGRATKTWVEGKELKMKGEFAPTPFAQEIKTLAENGFLRAFSVGFRPLDYKFNDSGVDFLKQELLEVSWVNVPAYAEALLTGAKQMKCGLVMKSILDLQKNIKNDKIEEEKKDGEEEEKVIFTKSELEKFKKDIEVKAGKVLSKKNRDLISSAIGAMEAALTPLNDLLEATNESADDKSGVNAEQGRTKATEAEKAPELDSATLAKIANKAIESLLLNLRKK
ncbi:MAG: HK97 family phage prohead protease [Parcubacteria group bacterium]|jgi:HK97 family phage prohead protease